MRAKRIDCIIFDCDGTLVDSERLQCGLLCRLLEERGIRVAASEIEETYAGWDVAQVLRDLDERRGSGFGPEFVRQFRALEFADMRKSLQAMAGVEFTLDRLQVRKCVASSSPAEKIELALQVTGLKRFFDDAYFSAHEIRSWKPEPLLFLHAARRMGVSAEHCVVVEDSPVGVEAAIRANMDVFHYVPSGRKADPRAMLLTEMSDLLSHVARVNGGLSSTYSA